jgi:hypothetical protein
MKVMAGSFTYRVVLNGIAPARSTQEGVSTDYMTYRAFAGQALPDASVGAVRCERQLARDLWRSHQI